MKIGSSEQELIERYVWDVIRRLPVSQRGDIEMELRSLIEDMAEEEQYESVEDILLKLGKPADLAGQYRGGKQYLIGPEYYEQYIFVLKIVLIVNLAFALLGSVVKAVNNLEQQSNIIEGIINFCVRFTAAAMEEAIVSSVGAIGLITCIFVILEYFKISVDVIEPEIFVKRYGKDANAKKSTDWKPAALLPIPNPKVLIKRGEMVFEIVCVSILCWLLIFMPEYVGLFGRVNGKTRIVHVFNLDIWDQILPFMVLAIGMSLIHSIVKLIMGRYGTVVSFSCIMTNIISYIATVIIFKFYPIWNIHFKEDFKAAFNKTITSEWDILKYIGTDRATNAVLLVLFIIAIVEIGVTVYKASGGAK